MFGNMQYSAMRRAHSSGEGILSEEDMEIFVIFYQPEFLYHI